MRWDPFSWFFAKMNIFFFHFYFSPDKHKICDGNECCNDDGNLYNIYIRVCTHFPILFRGTKSKDESASWYIEVLNKVILFELKSNILTVSFRYRCGFILFFRSSFRHRIYSDTYKNIIFFYSFIKNFYIFYKIIRIYWANLNNCLCVYLYWLMLSFKTIIHFVSLCLPKLWLY